MFATTILATILLGAQKSNITNIQELVNFYRANFVIDDVEYVYEGNMYIISNKEPRFVQGFNGNYALRMKNGEKFVNDTYLDAYTKKVDNDALMNHFTLTAINGISQTFSHPLSVGPSTRNIVSKKARFAGNFRQSFSPELTMIPFVWWQLLRPETRITTEFDVVGMQDEDDENLLLVTRDPNRNAGVPVKTTVQDRFFLSPSHGYQLKRFERMEGGQKVEEIVVKEFIQLAAPKQKNVDTIAWYPLSTEYTSYTPEIGNTNAIIVVKCATTILKDTIIVNQHPPDDRFSVFYAKTTNQRMQLTRLKNQLEYEKTFTGKEPTNKSVMYREALEKQLAAVNQLSDELIVTQNGNGFAKLIFNKWVFAATLLLLSVVVYVVIRRNSRS